MGRRGICAVLVVLSLSLCGCGGEKGNADNEPWNNGLFAIMETENGYYMNYPGTQQLRFHERETGTELYLCAKPECQHDGGEGCVATYHNMEVANSVLYNGAIYILGMEESDGTASFTLYRAALDGSALDKVGVVFSAKNPTGASTVWKGRNCMDGGSASCFIIHRGYAYVPFYLLFGDAQQGFAGGGIMKMDLKSGKTELIYEMNLRTDAYPSNFCAVGNYVYFDLYMPNTLVKVGTYRYNIEDGSVSYAFGEEWASKKWYALAVAEDKLYRRCKTEGGGYGVEAYDAESGAALGLQFEVDTGSLDFDMVPYQDYFFIYAENKAMVYNSKGEKLTEFGYLYPSGWYLGEDGEIISDLEHIEEGYYTYEFDTQYRRLRFYISQEKLYVNCVCINRWQPYKNHAFDVFSCPIKDILAENVEWTHIYKNAPMGNNQYFLYTGN